MRKKRRPSPPRAHVYPLTLREIRRLSEALERFVATVNDLHLLADRLDRATTKKQRKLPPVSAEANHQNQPKSW